jgi:hypothetical protein
MSVSGTVIRPTSPAAASRRIYLPVALLATLIALTGFWPTYFGPLLTGTLHKVTIIHVHAAVFSGWLLLVIIQATLAATGRLRSHMRVGRIGIAYGVVVIGIGIATALSQFAMRVEADSVQEAQDRVFAPLTDMLVFAPVLAAAWIYRRRPEIHKRLIVVATTVLLVAAVHRMPFFGGPPPPWPVVLAVWLAPIYVAMIYDCAKRQAVQPVYLLGIGLVLLLKFRGTLGMRDSAAWRGFVDWLTGLYA